MRCTRLGSTIALIAASLATNAHADGFAAALGKPMRHCRADWCDVSTIERSAPVFIRADGTLLTVAGHVWFYRDPHLGDAAEDARPAETRLPKQVYIAMVFCSTTRPYTFSFIEGRWVAQRLRPSDRSAVSDPKAIFDIGADYDLYWAACHAVVPASFEDQQRFASIFGYRFAGGWPTEASPIRQPSDLLK